MPPRVEDPTFQQAIEVNSRALIAEIRNQLEEAEELYQVVAQLLEQAAGTLRKNSEEGRRAERQLITATERKRLLAAYRQGEIECPEPLPSSFTIQREERSFPRGWISLTAIERGRRPPLTDPTALPPGIQVQETTQLYSYYLLPDLPETTYHIYADSIRTTTGMWLYLNVKNADKTETLYTLESFRKAGHPFTRSALTRCAEHHAPCVMVSISAIHPKRSMTDPRDVGRPFKLTIEGRKTIVEAPDRLDREWNPRRLTYGGQRFVWKDSKGRGSNGVSSLHEVVREWPDPKSKTGKKLDEVHPKPLVWGEAKFSKDKVCSVHMAGGLDQRFRELVLASELTKQMIQVHE
ncbi:hypothetical protein M422DRAFT_781202 [Sphaerobolus stellatus SS14]|uniref:Uncharacterized protein n=1 Tax=Sphaerobolus stellatus (strain SS14) TaxID=990650 RepID=A0A0C9VN16_SPHS4|nr:hypothetical protein M422DRAFT_781202 [Sphaerobolus stellatus SS14]